MPTSEAESSSRSRTFLGLFGRRKKSRASAADLATMSMVQLQLQQDLQALGQEVRLLRAGLAIRELPETTPPTPRLIPGTSHHGPSLSHLLPAASNNKTSLPMQGLEHTTMVTHGEAKSVFIVVSFVKPPYHGALYQVKLRPGGGDVTHEPPLLEPVSMLFEGLQIPFHYVVSSARIFSRFQLYLLLEDVNSYHLELEDSPFQHNLFGTEDPVPPGYIFDIRSRSLSPINSPTIADKKCAIVVSAYGDLYYFAAPFCFPFIPRPSFERYRPAVNRWEPMPPFPFYSEEVSKLQVTGYAVCYGIILFSMTNFKGESPVYAFHLSRGSWHQVDTSCGCVPFRGRAVVVDGTIYALPEFCKEVEIVAFSLAMGECDGGNMSLCTLSILRGLEVASPPVPFYELEHEREFLREYLVHLGNLDFVHVKSGDNAKCRELQYVCVTSFQIVVGVGGSSMIKTLQSTVCAVNTKICGSFFVDFCFTPDCEDLEPVEGGSVTLGATCSDLDGKEKGKGKSQERRDTCWESRTDQNRRIL